MGGKWWFTGDLHLDHPFMVQYRGFTNCPAHDTHIIDKWNDTVKPMDVVVVLGDIMWHSHEYNFKQWRALRGNKIIVKGNHDYWLRKYKLDFKRIYQKKIKNHYFVCCHYPMWTWNRKDYGAIHLHAHSHGKTMPRVNMLDVGVDSAKIILGEYRPFSMAEVLYLTNTTEPDERY